MENKSIRVGLILASTLIFVLVFILLYPAWGGISGIFGVIPVILAGWFFNWRYSIWVGLTIMFLNALLYAIFGDHDYFSILIGGIVAIGFSILVSRQKTLLEFQRARTAERERTEDQLRRQAAGLSTLVEASQTITASLNLEEVVYQIARELTLAIEASGCTLSYWNRERDEVVTWVEYRRDMTRLVDSPGTTYKLADFPSTRRVLENQQPIVVHADDLQADPAERSFLQQGGSSSLLMVPILSGGTARGLVELEDDQHREFTGEEITLCEKLAEQAASAIENANVFAEVQQRLEEQVVLRGALSMMASSLDLNEILTRLCQYLCTTLKSTSVYVCSYDPETKYSSVIAEYFSDQASDLEKESDLGESYHEDDESFLNFIDSGIPTIDQLEDKTLDEFEREHMSRFGAKTILYIPLRLKGQSNGYIEVWESRHAREFNRAEISIGAAIAHQAAIAIDNAQLYEQAQKEIVERQRAELAAQESESMMRSLAEHSPDHIMLLDRDLKIHYLNYPSEGLTIEQLIGLPLWTLVEADQQTRVKKTLEKVIQTSEPASYETTYTTPEGEIVYYETRASARILDDEVVGLVVSSRDIRQRKEMELRLEYLATHDSLTNLRNRRVFEDHLERTLKVAKRQNLRLDVAIIDLDNFKAINDTYGHLVGDQVLSIVAQRLVDSVREADMVARWGGDEFIILFVNPRDQGDIQPLVERLLASLSEPIQLEGGEITIPGSMGISTYTGGKIEPETMLRNADKAMYEAKDDIKGKFRFYQPVG